MISLMNVSKKYGNNTALDKINLRINSHEFFVLVGPSGSGKTTLLKMINRLNNPTSGTIKIDGQDISEIKNIREFRQKIGYVLQSSALFPNLTVAQNISVTLNKDINKQVKKEKIERMLKRVDLDPAIFMNRFPSELSGGEAQRVGIVRALIFEPNIILMDEPFSALDPISRQQLQDLLIDLHREFKTTIVFVTHDMQEALKMASRLAVLNHGKLQQVGTSSEITFNPQNQFVNSFFSSAKQLPSIQDLLDMGIGKEVVTEKQNLSQLSNQSNIYQLAKEIEESKNHAVLVDDKKINATDLIKYLSMKAGK